MQGSVNWSHGFLSDQAHQFVAVELANSHRSTILRDNQLLERCTAHLVALAGCSVQTAATQAAQVIAEYDSARSRVTLDMDRSTSHALFVVDRDQGNTRVISATELAKILDAHQAGQTLQSTPVALTLRSCTAATRKRLTTTAKEASRRRRYAFPLPGPTGNA